MSIPVIGLLITCSYLAASGKLYRIIPTTSEFGFGLENDTIAEINYLSQAGIQGPIFNSFDCGGYLIYCLYPWNKVFVDNRPEAYPASFFKQELLPALNDGNYWNALDSKYHFNTIILSHREKGLINFKAQRLQDPKWNVSFVGVNVLILTRNIGI